MSPDNRDGSVQQAVLTYVAAWNCADEVERRRLLAESFAADGTYTDPAARITGREELAVHARKFARRWPGATIELTSGIDAREDAACFTWQMVGADGTTLHEGIDYVSVDDAGRLREVQGFFGAYRSPHSR